MFNFGKTTKGDLELLIGSENVAIAYRVLCSASLIERRDVHALKTYIEQNFPDEIKTK
jgi:hypothetical protein